VEERDHTQTYINIRFYKECSSVSVMVKTAKDNFVLFDKNLPRKAIFSKDLIKILITPFVLDSAFHTQN
jgi:hypothetical protein